LRGLPTKELVCVAARFRLAADPTDVPTATKVALRSVARRYKALSEEISELKAHLDRLVAQAAPELLTLPGIGTDNAATLLVVAGDNPQRLRSEASFASLCGVAPIEASSGKVVRHRLNRGGNREANRALYMTCLAPMRRDHRTQQYVARRTREGKSKREIIRCLKRYVAREVYRVLVSWAPFPCRRVRKRRPRSTPQTTPLDHRSVTPVNKGKNEGVPSRGLHRTYMW
jgi:transposase